MLTVVIEKGEKIHQIAETTSHLGKTECGKRFRHKSCRTTKRSRELVIEMTDSVPEKKARCLKCFGD